MPQGAATPCGHASEGANSLVGKGLLRILAPVSFLDSLGSLYDEESPAE
jgi:hypothetical protein